MMHHIAHIMPFPSVGGVEIAALRLMQGLKAEGFRSTAFYPQGADSLAHFYADAGIEIVPHEQVQPSYRRPRAFLQNALRLAREFRRRGVQAIHCQDVLGAHYTGLAGRLAGLPVICHVRSQRPDITRRDASFLRAVDRFIFVSRNAWDCFGVKVGDARGVVIYDGFDFVPVESETARRDVRREFGWTAETKIVGMVARIARQKDYPTLVRSAARVIAAEPATRFLIVGDNAGQPDYQRHYQEVQALVAEAGLTGHFVFTGLRQDVLRLLAAMDVSVLCTHTEGFALSVLEAMGQGVPLVATAVGGLPEFVIEGETGFLHAHEDDAELAEKILALLRDQALSARLGLAGRQLVATKFNRQNTIKETAELYRCLIAGRPGARRAFAPVTGKEVVE